MPDPKLSLKWLDVFQAVARGGSVREAARQLGLSVSTVSHHLSCLEKAVGVALVDHGKRPLRLTPEGEMLLFRVDAAMGHLRKGVAELWSGNPGLLVRNLRIALVEDFDAQVTPGLAANLSRELGACHLSFGSRSSHEILASLHREEIDIGVASAGELREARLCERPLLRDPFVLVVPATHTTSADDCLHGASGLHFLSYSKKQLMGRRIEAQLRRLRLTLQSRLEFESTAAILALVAEGRGWTVTTALNVAAANDLAGRISVLPFPAAGFARGLSIFHGETLPDSIVSLFVETVRPLVQSRVIDSSIAMVPWLASEFRLSDPD